MDELLVELGVEAQVSGTVHRLVADWQLLADLSFADLLLLVPDAAGSQFTVVAQLRPTTGPTAYQDDLVGAGLDAAARPQLRLALRGGRICRDGEPVWRAGTPIREEALPVRSDTGGPVRLVVARDTNLAAARTPSRLEIAYLSSAGDLAQMLAEGRWPEQRDDGADGLTGIRVGDGLVRVDADGVVGFVSPNALSAYRRLGHIGDLLGQPLAEVTAALAGRGGLAADEPALVARGSVARGADVETGDAIVALRSLPLCPGGVHIGGLVLVHDVTEVRRHERRLLSKDATIREIHHRVKNNLQTVAALLRLQSRRMVVPEARSALEESVRRVASIAVVHETLSATLEDAVHFDDIADRVLGMVADVAGSRVRVVRHGSFGVLDAAIATPLVLVLTELVHNAVEHGYVDVPSPGYADVASPGLVEVDVSSRDGGGLTVSVRDHGRGLPAGFTLDASERLGLRIVQTLVETELAGRLRLEPCPGGGTVATVETG